jgi:hypothetical protein
MNKKKKRGKKSGTPVFDPRTSGLKIHRLTACAYAVWLKVTDKKISI